MTLETEKTKLVSNETIKKDIFDTEIEIDGFRLIMQGFTKLLRVDPYDARSKKSMMLAETQLNERVEFVRKLKGLLAERGDSYDDEGEE